MSISILNQLSWEARDGFLFLNNEKGLWKIIKISYCLRKKAENKQKITKKKNHFTGILLSSMLTPSSLESWMEFKIDV